MESTLSLKKADFEAKVGVFLGYGRGANFGDSAWTARQEAVISDCVESGLRQFYFPPPIEGANSFDWSFLKPYAFLTLPSGEFEVPLHDDFGGPEGQLTIDSGTGSNPYKIPFQHEAKVKEAQAGSPNQTGRPLIVAVAPIKGTTARASQRFKLAVFPTADVTYSLAFAYYLVPDALTGVRPYCYGGAAHTETILESCLAIAEQRLDDAVSVHTMKFKERLAASIAFDRRLKPQRLGYNRDGSDGLDVRGRIHGRGTTFTLNGVPL